MSKWYEKLPDNKDIVVSTRIRLARNLSGYCFPSQLKEEDAEKLVDELCKNAGLLEQKEGMKFYSCHLNKVSGLERASMVEWHIISPLIATKEQVSGLILSEDESIAIMLNEEDHIRIQIMSGDYNMKQVWKTADRIDDLLEEHNSYAFHERYGYLTACPTNVGTGLRASYMLFLPALTMAGKIERLVEEVMKYGVTIRGIYGEGSKSLGHLYQISNQKTLGAMERAIIDNLEQIVNQIMKQEIECRGAMLNANYSEIQDKVYRSYGVLKHAKMLDSKDAMVLLAQLKFGADTGLIHLDNKRRYETDLEKNQSLATSSKQDVAAATWPKHHKGNQPNLHQIMMEIQPATLQKIAGRSLGSKDRAIFRAEFLNTRIPGLVNES